MKKRLTLQASGTNSFVGYHCEHCGSSQVLSTELNAHCAYCGEELGEGTPITRTELTASPEGTLKYVKCTACETMFTAADSEESAHEIAASKYCVNCGGDTLVASDCNGKCLPKDGESSGESKKEEPKDEKPAPAKKEEQKGDLETKSALEDGIVDTKEKPQDMMEEQPAKKPVEVDASSYKDLQWTAVDTSEGEQCAMIAASVKTGNPVAIFHKKNAPESLQPLFAQSVFVSAFNEVAAVDGLATAIKSFGGGYFDSTVLTAHDIESAALAKMQATALPKFIDCCQMAVEGGTKGLYSDVYTAMQRSITNELIASGIDSERANDAVRNTFAIHGSDLFGTIVSKAMELYNKTDEARMEAKALIMEASVSSVATRALEEQTKARAALEKPTPNFGVLNLTASSSLNKSDFHTIRRELF